MTTVQTMLLQNAAVRAAVATALIVAAMLLTAGTGCQGKPDLVPPEVLLSPYTDRSGDVLWAVAPLANESGTSIVDALAVGDALVGKITEVQGIAAVPMNRTIAAMRSLQMSAVRSPGEARMLAEALGVDGLIVGSITAYDPYNPPTLGLTLALFNRGAAPRDELGIGDDPTGFRGSGVDRAPSRSTFAEAPAAVVIEQLPGNNHAVQMNVRRYAEGRHQHGSALGWERYLASMELYTDFAAHWVVRRLLEEERLRLARPVRQQIGSSR